MKCFSLGRVSVLLAFALGWHAAAPAATNWVLPPEAVSQTLATNGDAHIYYFFAGEGELVSIRVEAVAGSSLNPAFILTTVPADAKYQLPVSPECGNPESDGFTPLIADDDSGGGTAAEFSSFPIPDCGTYAIIVHSSRFATSGAYRLTVKPGDPDSNVIGYQGNFVGNALIDSRVRSWRDNRLIFDFDQGQSLTLLPSGHTAIISGSFSGIADPDIRLRRLTDGGQYLTFNDYKSYSLSPNANHIAFVGLFNSGTVSDVRVHEMPSGVLRVSQNDLKSFAFTADSRTFVARGLFDSGTSDDIALYRLSDGVRTRQVTDISAYSLSPSGEGLIARGDFLTGNSVEYKVLNARTGEEFHTNSNYSSEVYSPDGRYAAVFGTFIGGDNVQDLIMYDFRQKKVINTSAIRSFSRGVFAPHGQSFITFGLSNADNNLDVRVYSLPDGAMVHESLDVQEFTQFSPDGEILILRGRFSRADGLIRHRFIRLPSGAQIGGDLEDINNVYFSPAGTVAVYEGPIDDFTGTDYSIRPTTTLAESRFYSRVNEIKFDPSDDYYMARGQFLLDNVMKWDLARTRTGESILLLEDVTVLDFSPGGDALWIEYDQDDDGLQEKFLVSLPEAEETYRDVDDSINLTFEGFAPRGQGFMIRGDRDADVEIEYTWHASPEGTELYLLEDIAFERYSINGTFHALTGDFDDQDDEEDVQIRRSRTGQIADTRFDVNKFEFTRDEEAVIYEDTFELTQEFGFLIHRLANNVSFPQTIDIDTYQLSFDRYNPDLPQFSFSAGFEGGASGWGSGTAAPLLTPATFSAASDRLTITAANNLMSFGFWSSPRGVIPAPGNAIVKISAKVQSNVTPEVQTPHFRVRYGTDDNQVSALLRVNSPQGSALIPGVDGKTYSLIYDPPAGADGLTGYIAFDQLNFDPFDAPNGDTSLEEVVVDMIPRPILPAVEPLRAFEFSSDAEGWRPFAWTGGSPPVLAWSAGALQLIPTSRVDSFGFWDGPLPTISDLQQGNLYGARFDVATSGNTASRVPGFRLRLQDAGTSITAEFQVLSSGPAGVSPTAASPRQFTTWLYAMPGLGGASLFPSIDILSFDPDDDTETILLERVELFRMPLP